MIKWILAIAIFSLVLSCKRQTAPRYTAKQDQEFKENLLKANKGLLDKDNDRIESYVERRAWSMQQSQTGLWYEIYEQGTGDSAKVSQVAHINYKVYLLDGTYCYSSDSTGVLSVLIGHSNVESGLDEALLMMREGDKARFIMPPYMAHGLIGDENKIPPRSIIVYHAELIKLTQN